LAVLEDGKGRRAETVHVGRAAVMGGCFVMSFVVFGLTVEIFNLKLIASSTA
jgi:hypothetical protein